MIDKVSYCSTLFIRANLFLGTSKNRKFQIAHITKDTVDLTETMANFITTSIGKSRLTSHDYVEVFPEVVRHKVEPAPKAHVLMAEVLGTM